MAAPPQWQRQEKVAAIKTTDIGMDGTMDKKQRISPQALGINLSSKTESQTFRWLLACLLFGKPIRQEIAANAYRTLTDAGIVSIAKLSKTDWNTLVRLLDQAHYVRYDFSTATKLLQFSQALQKHYKSVVALVRQSADAHELEQRLTVFKGIGPVTAALFARKVAPLWLEVSLPHDYEAAGWAAYVLHTHGYEAYIVGGAVRDLLLNRPPKDFDLVTNATPEQITELREFERSMYKDTAQAYGVTRVMFACTKHKAEIEIATYRRDVETQRGRKLTKIEYATLGDDMLRRDFTINALALDPSTSFVIDMVDGMDDLKHKVIRFIGEPDERIREDPLRIMRAVRFKNHLGFRYHPDTVRAIRQAVCRDAVEQIATDRMRDELTALLAHQSREQAIIDLDNLGILERVLPEVTAGKGIKQPTDFHAEGDVWRHELLILSYLPHNPSKRLVWAALLHDIGKGPSRAKPHNSAKRIRFHRHYAVGAELAKTALRRLNFSNHDIKDITWMIYNHMAIDNLPAMRPRHRQQMMGHEAFEDLLELHRADAAASWRPGTRHDLRPKFQEIERLWHEYQMAPPAIRQPSLKRDLGIDGRWLLDTFRDEFPDIPGPVIGSVLTRLEDWYRDERAQNVEVYVRKARQMLNDSLQGL